MWTDKLHLLLFKSCYFVSRILHLESDESMPNCPLLPRLTNPAVSSNFGVDIRFSPWSTICPPTPSFSFWQCLSINATWNMTPKKRVTVEKQTNKLWLVKRNGSEGQLVRKGGVFTSWNDWSVQGRHLLLAGFLTLSIIRQQTALTWNSQLSNFSEGSMTCKCKLTKALNLATCESCPGEQFCVKKESERVLAQALRSAHCACAF